jgi:hypothetical protein
VTGRYAGTLLSYPEGNSNQQFIINYDLLLRPSQLADGINKNNNIFYPFISSVE